MCTFIRRPNSVISPPFRLNSQNYWGLTGSVPVERNFVGCVTWFLCQIAGRFLRLCSWLNGFGARIIDCTYSRYPRFCQWVEGLLLSPCVEIMCKSGINLTVTRNKNSDKKSSFFFSSSSARWRFSYKNEGDWEKGCRWFMPWPGIGQGTSKSWIIARISS